MPKYGKSGISYPEPKLTNPTWLIDLKTCNHIISIARKVCLQPDKFHIQWLKDAIETAEKGEL